MPIILKMMGISIVYVMVFVVLLSPSVASRVESKWEAEEPLLAYLIDSGEINQEMVMSFYSCLTSISVINTFIHLFSIALLTFFDNAYLIQ